VPPTILVVDDSILIRRHVRLTLEAAGFDVIEAVSGRDAMTKLEGQEVSLAICDINMPDVGGLAFLEAIRKRDRWRHLPVVFLTAEADPALIARARQLTASAWVVKPFEPKRLVETTRSLTARLPAAANT
jgi:two-component system chemotaxis response regulator CheY